MKRLIFALLILLVFCFSVAFIANAGYYVASRLSSNPVIQNFGAGAGGAAGGMGAAWLGAKIGGKIGAIVGGPVGVIIGAGLGAA